MEEKMEDKIKIDLNALKLHGNKAVVTLTATCYKCKETKTIIHNICEDIFCKCGYLIADVMVVPIDILDPDERELLIREGADEKDFETQKNNIKPGQGCPIRPGPTTCGDCHNC